MTDTCGPPLRCFQGVLPALIATADGSGVPNVTYLSQVFHLARDRVALSCQFFNKTKQNVLVNPHVCVILNDPLTYECWRLELRYLHAEESGPLFDTMSHRIQAIASHTGMTGVFKLLSADVYAVERCTKLDDFVDVAAVVELDDPGGRNELRGLHVISQLTARAPDLDTLLTTVLEGIERVLGFEHSMFLMPDECNGKLFTVASRGYGDEGVGAEVTIGEGLIGTVAKLQRLIRISDVDSELRYGRAIRTIAEQVGGRRFVPEIPLPGLPDAQSQMALPLLAGDRLVGVLAVESRRRLGFDEWDETFLEVVANQVAVGIENVLLRERGKEERPEPTTTVAPPPETARVRRFRFFAQDDCVFVDDDYLVRNVPGRILWKLLRAHVDGGRTEFSNRELRLDPSLGLPPLRDNLESRLVLLRKRLAIKCPDVGLRPTSRGHFRLETASRLELVESTDARGAG